MHASRTNSGSRAGDDVQDHAVPALERSGDGRSSTGAGGTLERGTRSEGSALQRLCGLTPVLAALVVAGAVVRAVQLLSGRSLWHDESLLAINLASRSLGELTRSLDFGQAAPLGFLFAEHLAAEAAGLSETALRIVPFLAGLAALGLFALLARRVLNAWAAAVAVFAFAVADGLVAYGSEVKPYSTDVLITVVLMLLGVAALWEPRSRRRSVAIGIAGALAILCSFPSVFVALSVVGVLVVRDLRSRSRHRLKARLPLLVPLGLGVVLVLVNAGTTAGHVRELFEGSSAERSTPDVSRFSLESLDVFFSSFIGGLGLAQDRPLSHLAKLLALAVLVGVLSLARRSLATAAMVTLPFALTFAAYAWHLYPATERTMLFLLPLFILLVAEGVMWPLGRLSRPAGTVTAVAAAVGVLAFPTYSAAHHLLKPRTKEEIRPVLEAVQRGFLPGDTLYLHPGAQYAFRYYADCGCLDQSLRRLDELAPFARLDGPSVSSPAVASLSPALVVGRRVHTDAEVLREDLAPLRGRVWVIYSHSDFLAEQQFLRAEVPRVLDALGRRLAAIERPGAVALLYDLS